MVENYNVSAAQRRGLAHGHGRILCAMRSLWLHPAAVMVLMMGCTGQSIKPAEVLDQRTGMTVGALHEPIELVQRLQIAASVAGKRASFAYLGPVEWDQSGHISYGLWLHVAPGNDQQAADLRQPGAVSLVLDDGPLELSYIDPPQPGQVPYHPVVSWGKDAYFHLDADTIKRLAASAKLDLLIRTVDAASMSFAPSHDTRDTLTGFARARGITAD